MIIERNNPQWIALAQKAMLAKTMRKRVEEIEEKLVRDLKIASQGLSSRGGGFKFELITRKGSIDYQSIPELAFIDLETYRKGPVDTWKLSMEMDVNINMENEK